MFWCNFLVSKSPKIWSQFSSVYTNTFKNKFTFLPIWRLLRTFRYTEIIIFCVFFFQKFNKNSRKNFAAKNCSATNCTFIAKIFFYSLQVEWSKSFGKYKRDWELKVLTLCKNKSRRKSDLKTELQRLFAMRTWAFL